jgi:hypothetical protein
MASITRDAPTGLDPTYSTGEGAETPRAPTLRVGLPRNTDSPLTIPTH